MFFCDKRSRRYERYEKSSQVVHDILCDEKKKKNYRRLGMGFSFYTNDLILRIHIWTLTPQGIGGIFLFFFINYTVDSTSIFAFFLRPFFYTSPTKVVPPTRTRWSWSIVIILNNFIMQLRRKSYVVIRDSYDSIYKCMLYTFCLFYIKVKRFIKNCILYTFFSCFKKKRGKKLRSRMRKIFRAMLADFPDTFWPFAVVQSELIAYWPRVAKLRHNKEKVSFI